MPAYWAHPLHISCLGRAYIQNGNCLSFIRGGVSCVRPRGGSDAIQAAIIIIKGNMKLHTIYMIPLLTGKQHNIAGKQNKKLIALCARLYRIKIYMH